MPSASTPDVIEDRIFLIRGCKVMIDRDLAQLYGVETKYLKRQVKRNLGRFPNDFMFQLNAREKKELVTNCHRFASLKHSSSPTTAFTEHGVAMLSSVLNSERAIRVNIAIIRTFIRLREIFLSHKDLAKALAELEKKCDTRFRMVFDAIRQLMREDKKPKSKIGFH